VAEIPLYSGELFRSRNILAVREAPPPGWLEIEVAMIGGAGSIVVRLDEFEARDLIAALSAWADAAPVPVGPRERA
jgi:hypothetical protein